MPFRRLTGHAPGHKSRITSHESPFADHSSQFTCRPPRHARRLVVGATNNDIELIPVQTISRQAFARRPVTRNKPEYCQVDVVAGRHHRKSTRRCKSAERLWRSQTRRQAADDCDKAVVWRGKAETAYQGGAGYYMGCVALWSSGMILA